MVTPLKSDYFRVISKGKGMLANIYTVIQL